MTLYSQVLVPYFINIGLGNKYDINLSNNNDYILSSSVELISSIANKDIFLGIKYNFDNSLDLDNMSHLIFTTLNIHNGNHKFKHYNVNNYLIYKILPDYQIGIKLNENSELDYIFGLYWNNYYVKFPVVYYISPSINYIFKSSTIELGLLVGIQLGHGR